MCIQMTQATILEAKKKAEELKTANYKPLALKLVLLAHLNSEI